jgi:ATP-dependent helicase/nuclease subunit B
MDRFERLLNPSICIPLRIWPSEKDTVADEERFFRLAESFERFRNVFRQWNRLAGMISEQMWVERFREMLEKSQLPFMGQSEVGVRVLDAMSARGSGFRALFLLGLNDQTFPRIVREDALLRDRDRRVLAESLGFKIDEKLSGFDEERLLFALLRQSARDRLYLLYQRSDEQGRSLIPSPLLSADFAGRDASCTPTIHLPLSLVERQALPLFSCETDTLEEARIGLLLRKQSLPLGNGP